MRKRILRVRKNRYFRCKKEIEEIARPRADKEAERG